MITPCYVGINKGEWVVRGRGGGGGGKGEWVVRVRGGKREGVVRGGGQLWGRKGALTGS